MRIALAVIYDSQTEQFETFRETEVHRLIERLRQADLVVGFNVISFDYAVLSGYTDTDLRALPTFDMLAAVHQRLGYRLALAHLAEETLGASKSADGLQSLVWWKEGKIDKIESYCRQDVALLRDLLRHAEENGHLCFRTKRGDRVRLPAPWRVADLVERARTRPNEAMREAERPRRPSRSARKSPSRRIASLAESPPHDGSRR
jgi:DEAD/DEAH box helicase domain-containing protein